MLRILHVLNDLAGGGAERLVLDLCRRSSGDIEHQVVTVLKGGALSLAFQEAGVRVRWAGRRRHRPGLLALRQIQRWAEEVDVVHTHLWSGDLWGGLAARRALRPTVSTIHNTRGDGPLRDGILRFLGVAPAVRVGVSQAVCRFTEKEWRDTAELRFISNGVDLSRFQPVPFPEGPPWRLLMVGRLTRQKGIDRLIAALPGLEDVELHLVGEGEEEAALRDQARGLPVYFHGWQSEVSSFYARSHVLVLPSRWEGFGLVAVEAMASGRVVVAMPVDGLDEILGDIGIRVDGVEPRDLETVLRHALCHPQDLRRRAARGPAQAAHFGIKGAVEEYESLYRELAMRDRGA